MTEEEPPKEKKVPEELTCPDWMMTMGDCMSLLLTFFVLLLTFSTSSKSQLMDVIGVMKGAFSMVKVSQVKKESAFFESKLTDAEQRKVSNPKNDSSSLRLTSNKIQRKFKLLEATISEIGFKNQLSMNKLDEGISIEIPANEVFVDGGNELSFEGKKLIQEISNIAFNILNEIRIVSNLKKTEMSGTTVSPEWLLANERNIKIVRLLVDEFGIAETRFSIGVKVSEKSNIDNDFAKITIIFVERLKVREVGIEELLKGNF